MTSRCVSGDWLRCILANVIHHWENDVCASVHYDKADTIETTNTVTPLA